MSFGEQLRAVRHELRLSLAAVCSRTGISVGYLSLMETGAALPKREKVEALREVLGDEAVRKLLIERDKQHLINEGWNESAALAAARIGAAPPGMQRRLVRQVSATSKASRTERGRRPSRATR